MEVMSDAVTPAEVVQHLTHELRQPLSAMEHIAFYLAMVLPRDDQRARQQVDKLQRLVAQANGLLDDAAHFLQAMPVRPQLLDLNELITEALAELPSHGLRPHLCEELAAVKIDPSQGAHLVRTVIAMYQRSEGASLSTCAGDREVRLSAEASSAPSASPLALASMRRIAEAHGGSAELNGPSLLIRLPRAS